MSVVGSTGTLVSSEVDLSDEKDGTGDTITSNQDSVFPPNCKPDWTNNSQTDDHIPMSFTGRSPSLYRILY